jgi:hypothetical protein
MFPHGGAATFSKKRNAHTRSGKVSGDRCALYNPEANKLFFGLGLFLL